MALSITSPPEEVTWASQCISKKPIQWFVNKGILAAYMKYAQKHHISASAPPLRTKAAATKSNQNVRKVW